MQKRNLTMLIGTLTIMLLTSCNSNQFDPESEEGFVSLYNGENFSGWELKVATGDAELAARVFSVGEEGMVHVFKEIADSSELNTGNNTTHGMMYTAESYGRYIFRFEYKWGSKIMNNFSSYQYDAGMYYHVSDDKIWPVGIEYQVRYDHTTDMNHTGDFWASSTEFQWYAGEDGTFLLPDDGGTPQPKRGGEHLAKAGGSYHALDGQWNQCEVIVMGDQYTIHKLNGEIVNMATELSLGEGKIGLQSETAEIFYRNIRIKELDKDYPMELFLK